MVISNKKLGVFLAVLLLASGLSGCAKYEAKSAYEEAEQLIAAEEYDQAVEKYFQATQDDPGNTTYKIKLAGGRTRAAAFHINEARKLAKADKLEEALVQYRLARGFDPSVEVAALEAKQLQTIIDARQKLEEGFAHYREKRYVTARQIANEVLRVDPQNARANDLLKMLDAKHQAVVMDGIELDMASNEPITLSFRQANIKEVFGILTQLAGINFLLDDEVKDKSVTILLEKATFSQAMELILSMAELGKKVLNSKTMIIFPQSKEKEKQYEDQIIQTFYLSHIDAKKAVNLLRTMLQLRKVYVHEERNALVVRDKPETIRLAEQVLKAADRSDSEVLFDVEVLAVRDSDALKFGPRLSTYSTSIGFSEDGKTILSDTLKPGSATDGLVQSLNNLQTFYSIPAATFDFAKTLNTTELLASPKIRVKNNEKAKVHIGKRDPIVTTSGSATDSTYQTQNIQYVDSGIKLDIEPNIQLDGTVLTKITLEVSSAERLPTEGELSQSPVALTITNAQTALVLIDGARTILGGLYENNRTNNKTTLPFIGEIPLLGSLFTNFDDNYEKREIILSITPYIVKKIEVPGADIATIWSGGEDDLMARPKFGAFAQALQSEVEAVTPAAAPALEKALPSPFTALQGRTAAVPNASAALPPVAETAPAPAAPPAPSAGPTAESLTMQSPPGAVAPPPAEPPASPAPVVTPPPPAIPPIVLPLPPKAPARLSLSGGDGGVKTGDELTLAVQVSGIDQLYSAPLFVNYDPALLEFVDSKEGTFLGQSGQTTVFSFSPNAAAGQVVVGYKQGVGGQGASGDGSLFTLRFRAKAPGAAKVDLGRINFRNPAGTRLAVEPATASIVIR